MKKWREFLSQSCSVVDVRPIPFRHRHQSNENHSKLNVGLFSLALLSQEKRRMDSHETHVTGDEDIIITKTIRSVSGEKLFDQ